MRIPLRWAVAVSLVLQASMALGVGPPSSPAPLAPPPGDAGTLELAVGLGSAQAYGHLGRGLPSLSDLGWALDVALGCRLDQDWTVGPYGSVGTASSLGNRNLSYSAAAGLQATRRLPLDAWVAMGFGWRGLWASDTGPRAAYQGLDVARLQLGFETAASPTVTLSPVLGATLTTYLQERSGSGYRGVSDPRPSVSLFAGLLVRFGVLASHRGAPSPGR